VNFDAVEVDQLEVTTNRGIELFDDRLLEQRMRLDRMFSKLMVVQWMAAVVVAAVYSPIAWAGRHAEVSALLTLAFLGGAALALISMLMVRLSSGSSGSRQAIAVCQILFSALFIHLSGGRIETHFHIFISLAWLALYLDGRILVTATVMVAADHLLRGLLVAGSVYGMVDAGHWRLLEHASWMVLEDVILLIACRSGLQTLREGAAREAELERLSDAERDKSAALEMVLAELRGTSAVA
jgi:hypothetical protein